MNKKLENLYNRMDLTPNIRVKEYMRASIILVDSLREKDIDDFTEADLWALEEIQFLSDQINRRPTSWIGINKAEV